MKTRLSLVLVAVALVAVALACAGTAAPARAAQSPAAIARHVLGHAPRGLAALVVRRGVVRVAVDANYPPQSSIDPSTGKPVGFDVDVSRAVGALLGLDVRFTFPAWETIPANLQKHRYYDVSIGSMEITPALRKRVDFATPYYYMAAQVVVKRGGARIHGVQDLFGRTVGVGAGTPYYDFLKRYPRIAVKTYVTDADAFPDLRSGKIDFLLTARETARYAIGAGEPFQFAGGALFHTRRAFAVGKSQADWLALLDYAVHTMHSNGSLASLSRTWYHGRDLTVWHWKL
jgi:polar amino acid transport system substrate-binding protein